MVSCAWDLNVHFEEWDGEERMILYLIEICLPVLLTSTVRKEYFDGFIPLKVQFQVFERLGGQGKCIFGVGWVLTFQLEVLGFFLADRLVLARLRPLRLRCGAWVVGKQLGLGAGGEALRHGRAPEELLTGHRDTVRDGAPVRKDELAESYGETLLKLDLVKKTGVVQPSEHMLHVNVRADEERVARVKVLICLNPFPMEHIRAGLRTTISEALSKPIINIRIPRGLLLEMALRRFLRERISDVKVFLSAVEYDVGCVGFEILVLICDSLLKILKVDVQAVCRGLEHRRAQTDDVLELEALATGVVFQEFRIIYMPLNVHCY